MSKPRPPKVNGERLKEFSERAERRHILDKMADRLEELEGRLMRGETLKTYIAFEGLSGIISARNLGCDDQERRNLWHANWGDASVSVPVALLEEIALGWHSYMRSPQGKTLGEAFGLEGGGQGRSPVKSVVQTADRDFARCRAVITEYVMSSREGEAVSLEVAKERVAEKRNEKLSTIEKAYKKHARRIRSSLDERRLFEPDKNRG